MAVITMALPPLGPSAIKPEDCERLYGGSVKTCGCRLPDQGGFLPCPPEARGELGPAPGPFAVSPAAVGAVESSPRDAVLTMVGVKILQPSSEAVKSNAPIITGEICQNPDCGAFAMVRTGTCSTCQVCGDSSGGCS